MTVARLAFGRRVAVPATAASLGRAVRSVASFVAIVVLIALAWEVAKAIGGVPWRELVGIPIDPPYRPPLRITLLNDINMPHVWQIAGAFFEPRGRRDPVPLGALLIDSALFTWREAALGFVIGGVIGLALAVFFVHSRLLERALVPYVIASQTIPIVALAPMVVLWFGHDWQSVVIISSYLTFFPVTIAGIRGLSSADPQALELMRSYAANRSSVLWKVRFPAAMPYLFAAFKISATASVVGAIVGEAPTGIRGGLGRAIIEFNLQYVSGPEKLWATVIACAALGVAFFSLIRIAEMLVLRNRQQVAEV